MAVSLCFLGPLLLVDIGVGSFATCLLLLVSWEVYILIGVWIPEPDASSVITISSIWFLLSGFLLKDIWVFDLTSYAWAFNYLVSVISYIYFLSYLFALNSWTVTGVILKFWFLLDWSGESLNTSLYTISLLDKFFFFLCFNL